MYGSRHMEVVGYDANGDPIYVGATTPMQPRPVGVQLPAGYNPAQPINMTPEQAAAILAQHGIMLPGALPQMLGVVPPGGMPMAGGTPSVYGGNPDWRGGQVAPGVNAPQEGMLPLPLSPSNGTGTFGAATGQLTFTGQLQKPFRGERLLTDVARVGTTATGIVQGQIFVGADLQQADIFLLPLEAIGSPTSFGTRLTMQQAPPGVLIRILTQVTPAPSSSDTVTVALTITGRVVH